MTEPALLVLAALVDEPRHGYGVVRDVDALSGGRVRLRIASLYGILDRLVAQGLAEVDREEPHQGRPRRYYRITPAGIGAVRSRTTSLGASAPAADRRPAALRPRLES